MVTPVSVDDVYLYVCDVSGTRIESGYPRLGQCYCVSASRVHPADMWAAEANGDSVIRLRRQPPSLLHL